MFARKPAGLRARGAELKLTRQSKLAAGSFAASLDGVREKLIALLASVSIFKRSEDGTRGLNDEQ